MTRDEVQAWLDRYVDAWRSYDADAIGSLFSEDASYAYHPYDDPVVGRAAVVKSWLGEDIEAQPEADGVAKLVELWLRSFGPGTAADVKWWLGATAAAVRKALADLQAVEVDLDGRTGYVLPDDLEPEGPLEGWAALLPPLDPTTMGWFERDWYLGPHKKQLFDASGNAGPTVWLDGRIVGCWRQSDTGEVVVQMLEDVGGEAVRAIEDESARLTGWLGGTGVLPRFPSPLSKAAATRAGGEHDDAAGG